MLSRICKLISAICRFGIKDVDTTWPTIARVARACLELEAFQASPRARQPDADAEERNRMAPPF